MYNLINDNKLEYLDLANTPIRSREYAYSNPRLLHREDTELRLSKLVHMLATYCNQLEHIDLFTERNDDNDAFYLILNQLISLIPPMSSTPKALQRINHTLAKLVARWRHHCFSMLDRYNEALAESQFNNRQEFIQFINIRISKFLNVFAQHEFIMTEPFARTRCELLFLLLVVKNGLQFSKFISGFPIFNPYKSTATTKAFLNLQDMIFDVKYAPLIQRWSPEADLKDPFALYLLYLYEQAFISLCYQQHSSATLPTAIQLLSTLLPFIPPTVFLEPYEISTSGNKHFLDRFSLVLTEVFIIEATHHLPQENHSDKGHACFTLLKLMEYADTPLYLMPDFLFNGIRFCKEQIANCDHKINSKTKFYLNLKASLEALFASAINVLPTIQSAEFKQSLIFSAYSRLRPFNNKTFISKHEIDIMKKYEPQLIVCVDKPVYNDEALDDLSMASSSSSSSSHLSPSNSLYSLLSNCDQDEPWDGTTIPLPIPQPSLLTKEAVLRQDIALWVHSENLSSQSPNEFNKTLKVFETRAKKLNAIEELASLYLRAARFYLAHARKNRYSRWVKTFYPGKNRHQPDYDWRTNTDGRQFVTKANQQLAITFNFAEKALMFVQQAMKLQVTNLDNTLLENIGKAAEKLTDRMANKDLNLYALDLQCKRRFFVSYDTSEKTAMKPRLPETEQWHDYPFFTHYTKRAKELGQAFSANLLR